MDLMARRRAIMGMPSGKDYTVSGNVVSISNALAKNAKSAIVTFLPKQSGSGDPSPNNVRPISGYNDIGAVRYGKNLLDPSAAVSYSSGKGYRWHEANGFLLRGNTTYTFSVSGTTQSITLYFRRKSDGETLASHTTSVSYTPTEDILVYLQAYRGTVIEDGNVFQLEYGSTATSYEPYISPVTASVHVGGAGKNKFNKDGTDTSKGYVAGKYLSNSGGEITPGSGTFAISEYIPISANTAYTVSGLPTSDTWSPSICQYDSNHTFITGVGYNNSATKTITSEANAAYVRMSIPTVNINSLQLEVGSSASTYEPYSIFGGTVDLVSGECVVDMGYVDLGTKNYLYRNSRFDATFSDGKLTLLNSGGAKAIASAYARSTNAYSSIPDLAFNFGSGYVNGSTCSIVVHDSRYTDATSFKSAVSGVILCYELATPITYHLTPSQLAMLKGNNTVYSNEGSISLTYVGK